MKFFPKPNKIIIQTIESHEEEKKSIIIQLTKEKKFLTAQVLSVGSDITFLKEGDTILYGNYGAICLDEQEKIYSIGEEGVICLTKNKE